MTNTETRELTAAERTLQDHELGAVSGGLAQYDYYIGNWAIATGSGNSDSTARPDRAAPSPMGGPSP